MGRPGSISTISAPAVAIFAAARDDGDAARGEEWRGADEVQSTEDLEHVR